MNVGINIALIVALALAAIAGSEAGANSSSAGIRGHNLNHNETLVRDMTL